LNLVRIVDAASPCLRVSTGRVMVLTHCSMCARFSDLRGPSPKVTDLADRSAVSRVECVEVWRADQTVHHSVKVIFPASGSTYAPVRMSELTSSSQRWASTFRAKWRACSRPAGSR
jgi:hypothetical protein